MKRDAPSQNMISLKRCSVGRYMWSYDTQFLGQNQNEHCTNMHSAKNRCVEVMRLHILFGKSSACGPTAEVAVCTRRTTLLKSLRPKMKLHTSVVRIWSEFFTSPKWQLPVSSARLGLRRVIVALQSGFRKFNFQSKWNHNCSSNFSPLRFVVCSFTANLFSEFEIRVLRVSFFLLAVFDLTEC